jgi:hypothetical protein
MPVLCCGQNKDPEGQGNDKWLFILQNIEEKGYNFVVSSFG